MAKKSLDELVLGGDIGGTNARLRLVECQRGAIVHEGVPSQGSRSLAAILRGFLAVAPGRVQAAVLGLAGPVVDGVSRTTNLPWLVDERALARQLAIPRVRLVNDMAAIAMGCTCARPSARLTLVPGRSPKTGNAAVIAAGTGLGEALLVWSHGTLVATATEGGHGDLASRNELQDELLCFLRQQHGGGHVSYERVLSGPGIGALYDFFRARAAEPESESVLQALGGGDRNAAITKLGLTGKSAIARQAIDTFATFFGAEVGNLILRGLATRGVYICGRIGATILPKRKRQFLQALRDKGRLRPLVEQVPIHLIDDDRVGLAGACHLARQLVAET
jgi:glucokinase